MSWRSGSKLFIEIWPAIQANIPEREFRIEFTAKLLRIFVKEDMDTWDVEDVDSDIRAAMRLAGLELAEPERYADAPNTALQRTASGGWLSRVLRALFRR